MYVVPLVKALKCYLVRDSQLVEVTLLEISQFHKHSTLLCNLG